MDSEQLGHRLGHVYWIGGGSGGGKSTISRRLAARHGLRVYSTDEAMTDHGDRCDPADCPFLAAFKNMDMDDRWVNRPPQTMLETFHWYRGESFSLIVEDLLKLPSSQGIIVEGFRLLPHLVKPLLGRPNQGVWLIPTPEFRLSAFKSRGTLWDIAQKTSHPERALDNLLRRDEMFTARIEREAADLGLPAIRIDASISENNLTNLVRSQFGL
ncbi:MULTISPECIES: hypothetical protein [unclassified Bradyrhizobium]|uniref:hypothetical protein n=1 Tax=unclassified Bradyrhizobium TaxID=2631580 RepID=UPI00291638B9|nr:MULTISPECIES: hypothetical protein [unclassified Bradyrhizobium]